MQVHWGVIPVAGRGTRMHPLSRAVPKELLPLGFLPVVQHVVLELVDAGLREIVFVISPNKPAMRDFLSDRNYWREQFDQIGVSDVHLHCVEQENPRGLGHAVHQIQALIGNQPFVVALGDSVLGGRRPSALLKRMLESSTAHPSATIIALEHVAAGDVSKYGIADVSRFGEGFRISDLVEKPSIESAPSRWAIAGRYVLAPDVHHYLSNTAAGHGGEIQLTDAIREMIRHGLEIIGVPMAPGERRFDIGEFNSYFKAFYEFATSAADRVPAKPRQPNQAVTDDCLTPTVVGTAFARAGLLGNPSDGYGGKTISVILGNWRAEVRLSPAKQLCFRAGRGDSVTFESVADFCSNVRRHGYYGGLRLIQAAAKRFFDYCGPRISQPAASFSAEYTSDIPRQLGLGGSSAIVIAALRALSSFYQVDLPNDWLPSLALSAETAELGIPAGLQDRVIQTFEGLMYMDFSAEKSSRSGDLTKGNYERLDHDLLPELYVAVSESAAEPTEVVHSDLRRRFEQGDPQVTSAIARFAQFAENGRRAILERDHRTLGELMNANFDLRRSISRILPEHVRIIEAARAAGATSKFCGSGGAIIGICPDGRAYDRLVEAMAAVDAVVVRPLIGVWHGGNRSTSVADSTSRFCSASLPRDS